MSEHYLSLSLGAVIGSVIGATFGAVLILFAYLLEDFLVWHVSEKLDNFRLWFLTIACIFIVVFLYFIAIGKIIL